MNDILITKLDKLNYDFNSTLSKFVIEASNLVELSEDDYQLEKSFQLNKISLKGYVLESSCCVILKDKGFNDYSIDELKGYLVQYENQYNEDCYKYQLALSLYELIEELESIYDSKIQCELDILVQIIPNIKEIQNTDKSRYEEYYLKYKNSISNNVLEDTSNIYISYLNDIISYYLNGYPTIPDEYMGQNNEL